MMMRASRMVLLRLCMTLLATVVVGAKAQTISERNEDGTYTDVASLSRDSLKSSGKEVMQGIKVWTVDERFGDVRPAEPDTLQHMFMNDIFTSGKRGEYNTTGNLGSPRLNRIFIDRQQPQQFMFLQPLDYFVKPVDEFHFTNTYSPLTNLSYFSCGTDIDGEDRFKAHFAVNANKQLGFGFKLDYIYARGYYQNQSTSHFNFSLYGSYLGDRYQAHLLFSTNHQKIAENGGITDDNYVTHPENYETDFRLNEIPTGLSQTWNRNDNIHVFLSHRYNIGFNRKVPMTEEEIKAKKFAMASQTENEKAKAAEQAEKEGRKIEEPKTFAGRPDDAKIVGDEPAGNMQEESGNRLTVSGKEMADSLLATDQKKAEEDEFMKNEYVPVTSFIHTAKLDRYERIYQAYAAPEGFYPTTYPLKEYLEPDSIYDQMKLFELKNTFAISLLEGFNKWAKAGLKGFITSDLRNFEIPDTTASGFSKFIEHNLSVGGQLSKTQGTLLHYNVTAETWLLGEDAGQLKVDATADLNFKFLGDSVKLVARGYYHLLNPTFFQRRYHSRHLWWDNSLEKETRTRIEGLFRYEKTRTSLRVAVDNLKNYVYFGHQYTMNGEQRTSDKITFNQHASNISLLTLQLGQDFTLGPLNWESVVTYQKSSKQDVLPVPDLNVYSNLYLHFKIARVLTVDLGGDVRFFTKYAAPDYCPQLLQYCVQENGENNMELGNYPIVNVYMNMHLKRTRFFIMMSHVNAGLGGAPFLTPRYPLNDRILRFGVSWNFVN